MENSDVSYTVLVVTLWLVIDMRLQCESMGRHNLPGIPNDVSKVLDLGITRWELQGLDKILEPSHFSLAIKGALYPDGHGLHSRLKGQLEMSISFVLLPVLALVHENVLQSVAESVLTRLVKNMKVKVNASLLADYSKLKNKRNQLLV